MLKDIHVGPGATAGLLGHSLPEIVTCAPSTTLTGLLKLFVEKRKHRIYVTARARRRPAASTPPPPVLSRRPAGRDAERQEDDGQCLFPTPVRPPRPRRRPGRASPYPSSRRRTS